MSPSDISEHGLESLIVFAFTGKTRRIYPRDGHHGTVRG